MSQKKDDSMYFRPLRTPLKRYRTVTYDLESKDGDTQKAGFTRPFLAWVYDGAEHRCFRQPGHLKQVPWTQAPWLDPGGIIDRMMRHLLGLDLCGVCEVANLAALADKDKKSKFKLCDECKRKRERYQTKHARIYAHNAGRFDALFIVPWLLRHEKRFSFEISGPGGRIQLLRVWPKNADPKKISWSFLDSVCILPMSLKAAGETFCGQKERKIAQDLDRHEDDLSWEAYNQRDCEVLYKAVESLNDRLNALGGDVGITAPAAAMSLYRHAFLKAPVHRNKHFNHCDGKRYDPITGQPVLDDEGDQEACFACAHDFVRLGYYGGRTELFCEWGKDVRYFDINSSYPRSMMEPMPAGSMVEMNDVQDEKVYENLRRRRIGFVECDVEIPEDCAIPPLPVRYDNKLIFPAGSFHGVWDWDELQLLKHPRVNGKVTKYYRSVWYESRPIFREMIDVLYGMRLKAKKDKDKGLDFLTKLMMNSCYGKLGQKVERGKLAIHRPDEPVPMDGRPLDGDPDTCGVWEIPQVVDAPYIVPQIAAKVTSESRIRLFLGMMSVLDQGGSVLYVDTDSIMCMGAVVQPEGDALGEWKREYPSILLDGTFVLPKLYQLRKHLVDCTDTDCPGCKWHLVVEDLESGVKFETDIRRRSDDVGDDFAWAKEASHATTSVKLTPPSVERMKGVPQRRQDAKHFHQILPKSKGGLGARVYIDGEMITQHRTMLREHLESPRVYRGIPGTPERLDGVSVDLIGDPELKKTVVDAIASGEAMLVERAAKILDRTGYGVIAEQMRSTEKFRARFKAVRSEYDKRRLVGGGLTKALVIGTVDGKVEIVG